MIALGFGLAGAIFFPNEAPGMPVARSMLASCSVTLLLFGSNRLLRRDSCPADAFGLQLNSQHARGFVLGVAGGLMFVALLAAAPGVQVPIHWDSDLLSLNHAALAAHTYFGTSFQEELIFRGYALVVASCSISPRTAVWAIALPFGLFHLLGMGSE